MKLVMAVDDDEAFLGEIAELLALNGFACVPVPLSRRAVMSACQSHPDVILLDLHLDEVDGFKIALALKRFPETSAIPVIAVTGYYDQGECDRTMALCGFAQCLRKPVDPAEMIAAIEGLIGGADEAEREGGER